MGRGKREFCSWVRFHFCRINKFEVHGTAAHIQFLLRYRTPKNGEDGNFYVLLEKKINHAGHHEKSVDSPQWSFWGRALWGLVWILS